MVLKLGVLQYKIFSLSLCKYEHHYYTEWVDFLQQRTRDRSPCWCLQRPEWRHTKLWKCELLSWNLSSLKSLKISEYFYPDRFQLPRALWENIWFNGNLYWLMRHRKHFKLWLVLNNIPSKKIYFYFHVYVCFPCVPVFTPHTGLVPTETKRWHQILWNWDYRHL